MTAWMIGLTQNISQTPIPSPSPSPIGDATRTETPGRTCPSPSPIGDATRTETLRERAFAVRYS
jgi:hypothetical protein